ncbi:hypothetical protein ACJX0J_037104, partial [Zea mays]
YVLIVYASINGTVFAHSEQNIQDSCSKNPGSTSEASDCVATHGNNDNEVVDDDWDDDWDAFQSLPAIANDGQQVHEDTDHVNKDSEVLSAEIHGVKLDILDEDILSGGNEQNVILPLAIYQSLDIYQSCTNHLIYTSHVEIWFFYNMLISVTTASLPEKLWRRTIEQMTILPLVISIAYSS